MAIFLLEMTAVDQWFAEDFAQKSWCQGCGITLNQYVDVAENVPQRYRLIEDIIISNPPYGSANIKLAFELCRKSGKPFALLIPERTLQDDWLRTDFISTSKISILKPKTRYQYTNVVNTNMNTNINTILLY